jgi:glycyl-tRNA synthetase beta chain
MEPLLIEIGTEEIPSGYIEPALNAFKSMLVERLQKARIECGRAAVYGTPRRLAVYVENVAARQLSVTTELAGPPERVAFDQDGRPTVAAQKFAEKAGVSISRLEIKETDKGRYLFASQIEKGESTTAILRRILPDLILSIPFPKTMRWKSLRIAFARPIHSIAALYGSRVISFDVGDVKSGRNSFGHRFLAPGRIRLDHADQYIEKLFSSFVIADIDDRKQRMTQEMATITDGTGGIIAEDAELLDLVCNLVEYPVVVLGSFKPKFLELPPEILVTAMREHQRYFAVFDGRGNMMPHFVAVSNNRARDMRVVVSGYERVLSARLDDARFFYNSDLKISLDQMVEKLKSVVFQAKLGSLYEKTQRVRGLCSFLSEKSGMDEAGRGHLDSAALYAKADLVSQVVIEFPKLQGVIGRIYAEKAGKPGVVASAIEEHYRPTHSGGALPETKPGALLGIADKLDTLCGCFLVGLVPTGASDPNALRRQTIGLIQTARAMNFDFSVEAAIKRGMGLFDIDGGRPLEEAVADLNAFFKNRMAHMLEEESIPRDMAAAILAVSSDNIPDVWSRAHAFYNMKSQPGFESLAAAFKRVVNIIRKADPAETGQGDVQPSLFAEPSESALYEKFLTIEQQVNMHLAKQDAKSAFYGIAGIKEHVDRFFDDVMVMVDDMPIRKNRLALLKRISDLFARLADFTKIST